MRYNLINSFSFFLFCFTSVIFGQKNDNFFKLIEQKQNEFTQKFSEINTENSNEYIALQKEYKKFYRWEWFWKNRVDSSGSISAYSKETYATKNINKLKQIQISNKKDTSLPTWKIIGPEIYPDGTNPSGIKGIGRIDAIAVNPKNKNHVIIGARAGGIWETHNITDSLPKWNCLTNNLPVFTVNDLKIINETIYACTSNKNQLLKQGYSRYGMGIIKKKLTENTWNTSNKPFESKKLAIFNKRPKIMFALGEKTIYKSSDAGNNWIKLNSPIRNIKDSKLFLTDIEVNPKDNNNIIITGKLYFYDLTNNKKVDILIFQSNNGGKTWKNLTRPLEKFLNHEFSKKNSKEKPIELTTGKKNQVTTSIFNKKLYICIQEKYGKKRAFFVTMSKKWKEFKLFNSLSKSKKYNYSTDNMDAKFKVLNDSLILIGNRKLRLINNNQHIINGLDNRYKYLHQDIRALTYNKSLRRLIIGTDGGINIGHHSKNSFKFKKFSNACGNLNLFLSFNMSYINTNETRTIRIGNQDTGYYKTEYQENTWSNWERFGNFGEGLVYTDPKNSNIVYKINAGGHGGNIEKSTDTGNTFKKTRIKAGNYVFAPLAIDENNTQNLVFDNYTNYDQYTLSLSNDQLNSSIAIANGNSKLDMGMNLALAISNKKPSVFYIARKDFHLEKYGINSSLFISNNFDFNNPDKITYTELTKNINKTDATVLNQAFISDIEVNDANENELWISFGNLVSDKKIFHSIDAGKTWENISTTLPNVPVNTIEFDAINKALYVGNDYGVYKLNQITKKWNRYGKNLPVCIVTTIKIDNKENELVAATHGRSVWTVALSKN